MTTQDVINAAAQEGIVLDANDASYLADMIADTGDDPQELFLEALEAGTIEPTWAETNEPVEIEYSDEGDAPAYGPGSPEYEAQIQQMIDYAEQRLAGLEGLVEPEPESPLADISDDALEEYDYLVAQLEQASGVKLLPAFHVEVVRRIADGADAELAFNTVVDRHQDPYVTEWTEGLETAFQAKGQQLGRPLTPAERAAVMNQLEADLPEGRDLFEYAVDFDPQSLVEEGWREKYGEPVSDEEVSQRALDRQLEVARERDMYEIHKREAQQRIEREHGSPQARHDAFSDWLKQHPEPTLDPEAEAQKVRDELSRLGKGEAGDPSTREGRIAAIDTATSYMRDAQADAAFDADEVDNSHRSTSEGRIAEINERLRMDRNPITGSNLDHEAGEHKITYEAGGLDSSRSDMAALVDEKLAERSES
jgi:hypothetical protein